MAAVARARTQAIVDRLPETDRIDNPNGCYFRVRRKIFGQVLTVLDAESEPFRRLDGLGRGYRTAAPKKLVAILDSQEGA